MTESESRAVDNLTSRACDMAMKAAAAYIRDSGAAGEMKSDFAIDLLCQILHRDLPPVIQAALADAREAVECNMGQVAAVTFAASMQLAGTAAVNKCLSMLV